MTRLTRATDCVLELACAAVIALSTGWLLAHLLDWLLQVKQ